MPSSSSFSLLFSTFLLLCFTETHSLVSAALPVLDPVISHKKAFEHQLNAHGLDALFEKLDSNGLMDNDLILFLDDTEIDALCHDVKLSQVDIYKFKSIIRKMRHENVIEVSTIEQRAFQSVADRLSNTTEIETVLKTYRVQHIDQSVTELKSEIDAKYETIRQQLQTERKALHSKIDVWAAQKTQLLHSEAQDVRKYNEVLQHFKREWIEQIKRNVSITRQQRDWRIVQNLSDILQLYDGKFMDKQLYLRRYAMGVTDNVSLHANSLCTQHIRIAFDPLSIPSYLEEPVLLETTSSGYKLALVWKVDGDGDCDGTRTRFRYRIAAAASDRNDTSWIALLEGESAKIGTDSSCMVHINNWFVYNTTFEFQMLSTLDHSIQYALQSNIQSLMLTNGTQNIELEFVSQIDNDIILRCKRVRSLYLPTTIVFHNLDGNIGNAEFEVFIGNVETNEWLALQLNAIMQNVSPEQSFAVLVRNSSLIRSNHYQHIKVRFNQSVAVDGKQFTLAVFAMSGIYIGDIQINRTNIQAQSQSTLQQRSSYFTLYNLFTAMIGLLIVLCLLNISTEFKQQKQGISLTF